MCGYLNENVTSTSYPHVNIAKPNQGQQIGNCIFEINHEWML